MEGSLQQTNVQFPLGQGDQRTINLTLHPIFEIPDDILALIFWMNTIPGQTTTHCVQRTLLASSHVCQRWRAVILGHPTLWGRIIQFDTDPIPRLQQLLHKSKPAPIDVGRLGSQIYLDRKQVMEILSENMPRIRTFNVKLSNRRGFFELISKQFFERPAPLLEFVSLSMTESTGTSIVQGSLFQDDAPYLRRLHLSRCTINFALSMPILSGLTKFSAKDIALVVAPSASVWLTNLLQMHQLRWLTIIDSIAPTHETFPLTQAHLPHLTMLSLKGEFSDCVALLDHITAPSLYGMQLKCSAAGAGHHFTRLLHIIEKRLSMWSLKADDRPQVILVEHGGISVGNPRHFSRIDSWDVGEIPSSKSGCHADGIPMCTLSLAWANPGDGFSCGRLLLFAFRPIFEVATSLVLSLDVGHTTSTSGRYMEPEVCFRLFEHLHTLHLIGESSQFILQALSLQTPSDIMFPSLKTLCFLVPRFHDQEDHFNALIFFIQTRKQLQPLVNVVVSPETPAMITRGQVDILEKHGVRIEINDALFEQYIK